MFKKIALTLLCSTGLICGSNAIAAEQPAQQQGIAIDFQLSPNSPQKFTNTAFWTIDAKCKISTPDSANDIYVHAIKKSGKINGSKISAGDSVVVTVHSGQNLNLTAESGAQVEITNRGSHTITASCTA